MMLPEEGFRTTEWSGGTTTELFIWPEDGSYKDRRFSVRISTALVELPESSFTPLPGVKRFLTPLCAGFRLTVNGREIDLRRGEVLEFSGGDEVACVGSGRDLNLMLKGAEGGMRVVSGAFEVEECEMAFIYSPTDQAVAFCGENCACTSAFLPARSFSRISPGGYSAERDAVIFTVSRV